METLSPVLPRSHSCHVGIIIPVVVEYYHERANGGSWVDWKNTFLQLKLNKLF